MSSTPPPRSSAVRDGSRQPQASPAAQPSSFFSIRDPAQLSAEVSERLLQSPKQEQLKTLTIGGKTSPYLPIEGCLENAASIFGADCNTEIAFEPRPCPVNPAIVECKVRISLSNGTVREGMGYAPFGEQLGILAHQCLTCISNGKKAAFKTFGPFLGLECHVMEDGEADQDATTNKEMLLHAAQAFGVDWSVVINDPPRLSPEIKDTLVCKVTVSHRSGMFKQALGYVQMKGAQSLVATMNAMKMCVNKACTIGLADFGLTVERRLPSPYGKRAVQVRQQPPMRQPDFSSRKQPLLVLPDIPRPASSSSLASSLAAAGQPAFQSPGPLPVNGSAVQPETKRLRTMEEAGYPTDVLEALLS